MGYCVKHAHHYVQTCIHCAAGRRVPEPADRALVGIDGAWCTPINRPHGVPPYDKEIPLPADVTAVPHDGKDDKHKPNPSLLFVGCAGALAEVSKVLDGGAKKYAADSWQKVPNGIARYKAAFFRHVQDMSINGFDSVNAEDFGLLHIDHAITDLLFIRQLMLNEKEEPHATA